MWSTFGEQGWVILRECRSLCGTYDPLEYMIEDISGQQTTVANAHMKNVLPKMGIEHALQYRASVSDVILGVLGGGVRPHRSSWREPFAALIL